MAWLWPTTERPWRVLGAGITAVAIVNLMRQALLRHRATTIIKPKRSKPQYITQDVEDSLKVSTLNKLLDFPNWGIYETTAGIIVERILFDGTTLDAVLWYATQPDYDQREKALKCLTHLMGESQIFFPANTKREDELMRLYSETLNKVIKPKTFAALMRCLDYCVTDYKHLEYDREWDNWPLRDPVEKMCILILGRMAAQAGIEPLLDLRFVERWLAKEPWASEDGQRRLNFQHSVTRYNHINRIVSRIWKDREGRRQLAAVGLELPIPVDDPAYIPEVQANAAHSSPARQHALERLDNAVNDLSPPPQDFFTEENETEEGLRQRRTSSPDYMVDELPGVREIFVDDTNGNLALQNRGNTNPRRRRDQSAEEEHLRRRHREAMVFNDGTRPLVRGDIIER